MIAKQPDGSPNHRVYRKPTHTDRYLNYKSIHHPKVKSSLGKTLVNRAYSICDEGSIKQE